MTIYNVLGAWEWQCIFWVPRTHSKYSPWQILIKKKGRNQKRGGALSLSFLVDGGDLSGSVLLPFT